MAIIFEIESRQVIPNWRDYKRTLKIGELSIVNSKKTQNQIDISRTISDWKNNKTIGTAADLVNSAFVANKNEDPEVNEAIQFILNDKAHASNSLIDLAHRINGVTESNTEVSENKFLELTVNSREELEALKNNEKIFHHMGKIKKLTLNNLYNPVNWVELSRLYSMFNLEKKAEKAMLVALNLAPNNRFVLRSATRLFIHIREYEKALFYLRKSPLSKIDPWIISAHIATSSLIERYSPLIKNGVQIIGAKNHSDYDLTELACAIGTFEYFEGTITKSKHYLEKALKRPNDNTLAQMEWLSKQDNGIFEFNPLIYNNVINPFEANAFTQFRSSNWDEAMSNTLNWFLDLPYSKRPVTLGAYIASTFMDQQDLAITLCELGLKANPHDPTILNNIVYSLTLSNRIKEAEKYMELLKKVRLVELSNEMKITLQATMGLLAFRTDNKELGKELYKLAIDNCATIRDKYLENLALLNYARELILSKDEDIESIITKVSNIDEKTEHKEINFLKTKTLLMYNKFKNE